MLKSIRIQNYRNIEDETLELGPLQVLVGKNGVGKSNIVDAFRFIGSALRFDLGEAIRRRHRLDSLRRRLSEDESCESFALTVMGVTGDEEWEYHIEVGGTAEEHRILREWFKTGSEPLMGVMFDIANGEWRTKPEHVTIPFGTRNLSLSFVRDMPPYAAAYEALTDVMCYTIFPNALREPQKPERGDILRDTGENLYSVLHKMQTLESPAFLSVREELSLIVDNVDDVRVVEREGWLFLQFHHPEPEPHWLDASQQSDGTLRALGILVALHQPANLSLIAIEEPELTLHPVAIGLLCEGFLETAERMQVLLTTHSPDLISLFPVEYLRVVELRDGLARVGPIDEAQRLSIEEELFTTGDILRIDSGLRRATN